jgi:predicted dienelactone hydrolase
MLIPLLARGPFDPVFHSRIREAVMIHARRLNYLDVRLARLLRPRRAFGRLQAAAQETEAVARAADVRFALDRMLSDETGYRSAAVNRQRLIAAGHSYGANTTLLTVGAQVVRSGRTIDCLDPRKELPPRADEFASFLKSYIATWTGRSGGL